MSYTDDRLVQVMERLLVRTRDKSVDWKQGSPTAFWHETARATLTVYSQDSDDQAPYVLEVQSNAGTVLARMVRDFTSDPVEFEDLRTLYEMAKDKALGIAEVLDEVLKELE